ncbi:MAG: YceI family protein [Balneolaceae bacterium]
MNRLNTKLTVLFIPLLFSILGDINHPKEHITPLEESRIWIEGRSNVDSFTCVAGEFLGEAWYKPRLEESETDSPLSLNIEIPVETLNCGRNRMNRDLYEALQGDKHSSIRFEYLQTDLLTEEIRMDTPLRLRVRGLLTVAGTQREISFEAEGRLCGAGVVRVKGSNQILMTDYNIIPPNALIGFIKAQDELTVHFDILAEGGRSIQTINEN